VRYGDTALFVLSLGSDDVLAEAEEVSGLLQEGKVVLAREGEPCGQLDSGIAALRTILVATHCLDPHADDRLDLLLELLGPGYPVVRIDQAAAETLIPFRKAVYDSFALLRVYTKQPGKPADRNAPFVLRQGSTLEDLAGKIHKDIRAGLQYARVWKLADNAIDGLRVPRDYRLEEGDVVEIHA
jgi:ribosome-interacting GTPase 1